MTTNMQPQAKKDPFIRSHRLLPVLLMVMGGLSKYDLMDSTKVFSKLYKLGIILLINCIFWATMFFFCQATASLKGLELGIVTSLIGFNLNFIYSTISLLLFQSFERISYAMTAHVSMKDILEDLDTLRNDIGGTVDHIQSTEKQDTVLLLFEIVSLILMCSAQLYAYPFASYVNPVGLSFLTFYSYILRSVMDHSFITFLRQIGAVFECLQDLLRIVTGQKQDLSRKGSLGGTLLWQQRNDLELTRVRQTRSLFMLYRKCISLCHMLNKLFALQTFFSIALSFFLVITFLFLGSLLLIQKARGSVSHLEFGLLLGDVLIMILIHLLKLLYLISVCNNTCLQANKILQLGRKAIIEDKTPELNYELTVLVQILKEEKVVFTAHDFFPIDYPLFISFIGAASTYWVIMVQFQLTPSES